MAPVTIEFSNLGPNTTISNQYEHLGLVFDPPVKVVNNGQIVGNRTSTTSTFVFYKIRGRFKVPCNKLSLRVTDRASFDTFASDGRNLTHLQGTAHPVGNPGVTVTRSTELSIGSYIGYFETKTALFNHWMSSLTFDDTSNIPRPDYSLLSSLSTIYLRQNIAVDVPIKVHRINGSTGRISVVAIAGSPEVLIDNISPNPFSGTDNESFHLTVRATAFRSNPSPIKVSCIGLDVSAGFDHFVEISIPVVIQDRLDTAILGIELTQGIQSIDLFPETFVNGRGGFRQRQYSGVPLVTGKRTRARVFSGIVKLPRPNIPDFRVRLHGSNRGGPLAGSPLVSSKPVNWSIGTNDEVPLGVRVRPGYSADFILPPHWIGGTILLYAELFARSGLDTTALYEAPTENNSRDLTVDAHETTAINIRSFQLHVNDATEPIWNTFTHPTNIFTEAQRLMPVADGQLRAPWYEGSYDISAIYNDITLNDTQRATQILTRLRVSLENIGINPETSYPCGMFPSQVSGDIRSGHLNSVFIVQDEFRLRTSVAHELGHKLGRKHASAAGGAANPEDWPPDQLGYIQGIGVDVDTGDLKFTIPPATEFFDFMGYSANDTTAWNSPRGWNHMYQKLRQGAPSLVSIDPVAPLVQVQEIPQRVVVHALVYLHHACEIVHVKLGSTLDPTKEPPDDDTSDKNQYVVYLRTESGEDIAKFRPVIEEGIIEGSTDSIASIHAVIAVKDANKVALVEITKKGEVIATANRPKNGPVIKGFKLVAPDPSLPDDNYKAIFGLSHAENLPIHINFELCRPDSSWHVVYMTKHLAERGNSLTVNLSSRMFPASKDSSVLRLRLSDGFNETTEDYGPFSTVGSPPDVHIMSPTGVNTKVAPGSSVYLHAVAMDDMGVDIGTENVKWSFDGKPVATGPLSFFVPDVAVRSGKHRLEVEATDSRKRVTRTGVDVEILAD
jgi:hypothetical protein